MFPVGITYSQNVKNDNDANLTLSVRVLVMDFDIIIFLDQLLLMIDQFRLYDYYGLLLFYIWLLIRRPYPYFHLFQSGLYF